MLSLAVALIVALAPGGRAPEPGEDTAAPPVEDDAGPDRKDPCGGKEGWVGDGEDGRDPPACDGPGTDPDVEAEGLHAPDWLRREEDGEGEDGYER